MRVAIVGAGASGLPAIKCCLDEGLEPVCFERTNDIGGLWRYTEKVTEGQSCVMKSTVINTSKEMMCYSDFKIPDDYPVFMHNTYVQKYFNLYADEFGLRKYIRFETEVLSITKHQTFNETGKWDVKIRNKKTGSVDDLVFDAVMICSGHHADKNLPDFQGLSEFKGQVFHSHDYRHIAGYENKRVVVVGIGNSGGDVAVELSRVASQVYLSTRRGSWVFNKIGQNGLPIDMLIVKRIINKIREIVPASLVIHLEHKQLNKRFDHEAYGLQPKHSVFSQHPTANDDIPNRLASGTLKVKPDISRFTENGILFEDGTREDNIDAVILATGYKIGFPYVDKSIIDVKDNHVELYKYVFLPKLEKQTLSVIGCIQPFGAIMPISELQCRLATRVFQGEVKLPTPTEMMEDIRLKRKNMAMRFVKSNRHTIQVDFIEHMDEIAALNGTLPDLKGLVFKDPKLALACYFGPCTPYQYRLNGPGKWAGAREAILTQWSRVKSGLRARKTGKTEQKSQTSIYLVFFSVLVLFCLLLHFIFS